MPYVVAIPIPQLDRHGRRTSRAQVDAWKNKALLLLGDCFGGALALRSPGPYRHQDGTTVFDTGQWVVYAGCAGREVYLSHQARVESFAEEMGSGLDQEAVFVLALESGDSVLLFLDDRDGTS